MGLGLFIAKTLLERSGAELSFANGFDSFHAQASHADRTGAVVEVSWSRAKLESSADQERTALGKNQHFRHN